MDLLNPNHGEPVLNVPAAAPSLPLESEPEPLVITPAPILLAPVEPPKRKFTQRALFPWLVVLGILVVLLIIFSPIVFVKAGHRGVATFFGDTQGEILGEGAHFKYPLLRIHQFDVRTQSLNISTMVGTNDAQTVRIAVEVAYRLDSAELKELFDEYGEEAEDVLLASAVEDSLNQVATQFSAVELFTRRVEFKDAVTAEANTRLTDTGLILEQISIVNVTLSRALEEAFEARAVTEQAILEQQLRLEAELAQIEQEIAAAKLGTERIRILGEALKGHEAYILYEIMQKWDGQSPLYITPITPPQVINNTIENPAP